MALLTWSDSYGVGVGQVDLQHKRLFALVNELHDSMKCGQAKLILGGTLQELVAYTKQHFRAEELLLGSFAYPELHRHKLIHEEFTAKISQFQEAFKAGTVLVNIELMEFLSNWLVNHIQGTDQKYFAELRKSA